MLHVQLLDDTQLGFANPLADLLDPIPMQARFNFGNPSGPQLLGETVIDLEDRWFCKEWTDNTVYKPREVRDLYNPKQPGLSVGKMMVMVDAVLFVDSDEKPPRNVNIAGRQMPMEMRVIVWNLRDVSPKEGYTSNVQVVSYLAVLYAVCFKLNHGFPSSTATAPFGAQCINTLFY